MRPGLFIWKGLDPELQQQQQQQQQQHPADFARKYLQMTVHRFLSTIFYLQYFNCYILPHNNLIAIYNNYICIFKPLLEGS